MTSSPDRGRAVTPAELRDAATALYLQFFPQDPVSVAGAVSALRKGADRIAELEAALRWYSNENNWCDTFDDDASTHLLSSSAAEDDAGHRARVALGEEK